MKKQIVYYPDIHFNYTVAKLKLYNLLILSEILRFKDDRVSQKQVFEKIATELYQTKTDQRIIWHYIVLFAKPTQAERCESTLVHPDGVMSSKANQTLWWYQSYDQLPFWIFDEFLVSQTVFFISSAIYIIWKVLEYTFQKSQNLEMLKLTEKSLILTRIPP